MRSLRAKQLLMGIAGIALAFGTSSSARAQDTAPAPDAPQKAVVVRTLGPGGDAVRFMGFEAGIGGKTVTNAPFTATVSIQVSRTLADGNKIDRTTTGTIARDAQGRTRREMQFGAILDSTGGGAAPRAVFINDPVSGTTYILHPNSKTANQVPFRMLRRGMRPMVRAFRNDAGIAGKRELADQQAVRSDLGTQTINGVPAQGTRITRTIPAGQIGNEKPIVIVTETWYSPDLQTYVLRKTTNPLSGNTTFQLTNIQQGEPDPTLFQVPSDYTVKQPRMFYFRQRRGMQAPSQRNQTPDQQNQVPNQQN